MLRKLTRGLLVVFLAAVFVLTAASLALRFALNPALLEQQIVERLRDATGRDAGFAQASAGLFSGLVIKDFYLPDPAPSELESVTCGRALIGVSLWDLLRQELTVQSVSLRGPHVELVIEPDGSTNFADILARLRGEPVSAESPQTGGSDVPNLPPPEVSGSRRPRVLHAASTGDMDGDEEKRPWRIGAFSVTGGSMTVLRRAAGAGGIDRYLDITDLSVRTGTLTSDAPVDFSATGSIGVERQSPFTLHGTFDPTAKSLDVTVEFAVVTDSLAASLLDFAQLEDFDVADGEFEDIRFRIRTGENFTPVDVDGEMDLNDIEAEVGAVQSAIEGDFNVRASYHPEDQTLQLSRLFMENSRSGEDGEFNLRGELDLARGEGTLQIDLTGVSEPNLRPLLPRPLRVTDRDTWLDVDGELTLSDGFRRAAFRGAIAAQAFAIAAPPVAASGLDLRRMRADLDVAIHPASSEVVFRSSRWEFPGLTSPGSPIRITGSSLTSFEVELPPVDASALSSRLTALPPEREAAIRWFEIAAAVRGMGKSIPLRVTTPLLRTADGDWTDVRAAMRLGATGAILEQVTARLASGSIALSGPIGRTWKQGVIEAENLPLSALADLIGGIGLPAGMTGETTGEWAGTVTESEGLTMAAVHATVRGATLGEHWILEELSTYTGLSELRAWDSADARLTFAWSDGTARIAEIALSKSDARISIAGTLRYDGSVDLAAAVAVPAATAQRLAGDSLFARANRAADGWMEIRLGIGGQFDLPAIRPIGPASAEAIAESAADSHMVAAFTALGATLPATLERVSAEIAAAAPQASPMSGMPAPLQPIAIQAPPPVIVPSLPSAPSVRVEAPTPIQAADIERQEIERPQGTEPPPLSERTMRPRPPRSPVQESLPAPPPPEAPDQSEIVP